MDHVPIIAALQISNSGQTNGTPSTPCTPFYPDFKQSWNDQTGTDNNTFSGDVTNLKYNLSKKRRPGRAHSFTASGLSSSQTWKDRRAGNANFNTDSNTANGVLSTHRWKRCTAKLIDVDPWADSNLLPDVAHSFLIQRRQRVNQCFSFILLI